MEQVMKTQLVYRETAWLTKKGRIIENLATIGYDPTNSLTAAYDWRLSYGNLEVRGMVI